MHVCLLSWWTNFTTFFLSHHSPYFLVLVEVVSSESSLVSSHLCFLILHLVHHILHWPFLWLGADDNNDEVNVSNDENKHKDEVSDDKDKDEAESTLLPSSLLVLCSLFSSLGGLFELFLSEPSCFILLSLLAPLVAWVSGPSSDLQPPTNPIRYIVSYFVLHSPCSCSYWHSQLHFFLLVYSFILSKTLIPQKLGSSSICWRKYVSSGLVSSGLASLLALVACHADFHLELALVIGVVYWMLWGMARTAGSCLGKFEGALGSDS